MTLAHLAETLATFDDTAPLIFTSAGVEIGAGYHVTELKSAQITSIDCAANIREWQGASLELLDGEGATHMTVGHFLKIVTQSIKALPQLADARFRVEFSPKNQGLELLELGEIEHRNDAVFVALEPSRVQCKPLVEQLAAVATQMSSECCGPAETTCC